MGSKRKAGNPLGIVGGFVGRIISRMVWYCNGKGGMVEYSSSGFVRSFVSPVAWDEEQRRLSPFMYTKRRSTEMGL